VDKDDLDNPKYDEQVFASIANNDTGRKIRSGTLISMGSTFSEDPVSQALGGFSSNKRRDSGFLSISSAEGSVDEKQML